MYKRCDQQYLDFVYEYTLKNKQVCKHCGQQYLDLTLFMNLHWKISKLQTLWSTISQLDFVYEPTLKNKQVYKHCGQQYLDFVYEPILKNKQRYKHCGQQISTLFMNLYWKVSQCANIVVNNISTWLCLWAYIEK